MPAPTRKTTAPRKTTAATAKTVKTDEQKQDALDAAVAEATGDDSVLNVKFRGHTFKIERDILSSARFLMAIARGRGHELLFELLGPNDSLQFINLLDRGEQMVPVSAEFFKAVNAAAGLGNS